MTLNLGYLAGVVILFGVLLHLIAFQIRANEFRPLLYWTTIVAPGNGTVRGRSPDQLNQQTS